jgi:hypothetical protein
MRRRASDWSKYETPAASTGMPNSTRTITMPTMYAKAAAHDPVAKPPAPQGSRGGCRGSGRGAIRLGGIAEGRHVDSSRRRCAR